MCHREVFAEADKDRNGVLSEEESILFFKSLVEIQKFNKKLEKQTSSSEAGRVFVTGHHVEKSWSHVKKRCNSSQTFAK